MPPRKYAGRVVKALDYLVALEKARGGSELSEAMRGGVAEAAAETELGKAIRAWMASWDVMREALKALGRARHAEWEVWVNVGKTSEMARESHKKIGEAREAYMGAREAYMKARGTLAALAKAEVAMEKARGGG